MAHGQSVVGGITTMRSPYELMSFDIFVVGFNLNTI
jgi:hypothetical protein